MFGHELHDSTIGLLRVVLEIDQASRSIRLKAEKEYWDKLERSLSKGRPRDIILFEDEFLDVTMTPQEFAELETI